jgi:purine-cytosine permease-like protein
MESSRYQPPTRQSLSDAELSQRVNQATESHTGLEAVMELLVTQEALRAQEEQELAAWIMDMESEGSEESIAALARHRGQPVPEVVIAEPVAVEPVAETPVVEEVPETPVSEPFSWFTKTDEVEIIVEADPVSGSEEVVEEAIEPVDVIQAEEVVVVSEVEVVEEMTFIDLPLQIEGAETEDEFEKLLVSAAAEEELTALEDTHKQRTVATKPSNVQIPTDEHRNRKPFSQLGVWLGLSATVVPIMLAWTLLQFQLSFATVLIDLCCGYLIAGSLIAISSLAGKRSGLSTTTISRAVFGVWGNAVPLSFVLISRVILTALAVASFGLLMDGFDSRVPVFSNVLVSFIGINITTGLVIELALLVLAFGIALVRGPAGRILQTLISLLAFGFIVEGLGGFSAEIHNPVAGSIGFISKESLGAILIVALVVVTAFMTLAPNLAKSIPMKHKGLKVFNLVLIANFAIPALVAVVAAAWLASDRMVLWGEGSNFGFAVTGARDLLLSSPVWIRGAIGSGVSIGIIYIVAMSLRTAAQDVLSLFRFKSKTWALVIGFVLTLSLVSLMAQQPQKQLQVYLVNMLILAAVLSVGWMGMFVADVALRRIAYHELSLTRSYGFYGKFNVVSFIIWMLVTAEAVLFIPVNLMGLGFTGMLLPTIGLGTSAIDQALGFGISFTSAVLLTVIIRIPQIRKQEKEVVAVESRREQLNDIFVGQD